MYTLTVDPVTAALVAAGQLSWVTVDREPERWIGQRVAIYADDSHVDVSQHRYNILLNVMRAEGDLHRDAIVGSGTLAEALPVVDDRDDVLAVPHVRVVTDGRTLLYVSRPLSGGGYETTDISDQLPLQDWTPGRWALRFTDVAPTGERCALARDGVECSTFMCHGCGGAGHGPPIPAPVLSGDDPTYKEWTP